MKDCKEYLEKQKDGTYALVLHGDLCKESDILIPDGAEIAIQFKNNPDDYGIVFYKNGGKSCMGKNDNNWQHDSEWTMDQLLNENYHEGKCDLSHKILWQREQDEPFLTPETTLNDQYAEIEQVRQESKEIYGTSKAEPDFSYQYADISKVRKDEKQERNSSAWDVQIGGNHYKQFKIQPMQFALENKLDAAQHNVIKYIMRHSFKNGKQDLEKAKHYIDLMIEFYYGDNNNG